MTFDEFEKRRHLEIEEKEKVCPSCGKPMECLESLHFGKGWRCKVCGKRFWNDKMIDEEG
jgi:tRNA(Ile2) C34 agmatinyltransferase TiaS